MSKVEEIEKEIEKLPREEFWKLAKWFDEKLGDHWDRQVEEDAVSGKLDRLFEEADRDFDAGRCRPL